MPVFWLSKQLKAMTLYEIKTDEKDIHQRQRRKLHKMASLDGTAALRNTDNSEHYNGKIHYTYNIALMPSKAVRKKIKVGRFLLLEGEYLRIFHVQSYDDADAMFCAAQTVDMGILLNEPPAE